MAFSLFLHRHNVKTLYILVELIEMSHTIEFSVHLDPKTDQNAQPTYHVRQDNYDTANKDDLLQSVKYHGATQSITPTSSFCNAWTFT